MIMERPIKIAVENGWLYLGEHVPYIPADLRAPGVAQFSLEYDISFLITKEQVVFDPLFWQALGRGLKWEPDEWKSQAKWLMEHVMNGGDLLEFFNEIY